MCTTPITVGASLLAKASSATPQNYLAVTSIDFFTAGFNTSHNAAAINTPPYMCAIESGSSRNNAPHNTPNGGIRKVVVIDFTGPTELNRRK
jgi:hypothetical protein